MYKICFVSTVPATMRGFVLPFVKYLHAVDERLFDISLICSPIEGFPEMVPEYVHYFPIEMRRGIDSRFMHVISQMKQIFKKEKFDLVQYTTPNASFYASMAAKCLNIPVRLYCQWGLAFEANSGIKRKLFMWLERTTCRNSTWVEPDSVGNLLYCRSLGFYDEKKSSVVLHGSAKGVDLSVFDIIQKESFRREARRKYKISENAFVFGYVGSITGDKGINELLDAFKSIIVDHPEAILMMVGDTEKESSLNSDLLRWAKGCNSIVFTGHSDGVQKEMAAMDCYVTPSYREGFGTTVIEAGAMGLPVISSDIPGPTDAITDGVNGLLVEKKNVEQLSEAMIKMINTPALCEKFGAEGLKLVKEKYNQQKVFDAIIEDRKRLLRLTENQND